MSKNNFFKRKTPKQFFSPIAEMLMSGYFKNVSYITLSMQYKHLSEQFYFALPWLI